MVSDFKNLTTLALGDRTVDHTRLAHVSLAYLVATVVLTQQVTGRTGAVRYDTHKA